MDDGPADAVEVEAWCRRRTDIEDRIRDAKLGAALRHLPSGQPSVNQAWTWTALLACNLSVLLQALTGLDTAGRAHAERLRRELINIPGRIIRHARWLELRLPPRPDATRSKARRRNSGGYGLGMTLLSDKPSR